MPVSLMPRMLESLRLEDVELVPIGASRPQAPQDRVQQDRMMLVRTKRTRRESATLYPLGYSKRTIPQNVKSV